VGQISFAGLQLKPVLFLLFVDLEFGLGPELVWICSSFYPCKLRSGLKLRRSRAEETSGGRFGGGRNHREARLLTTRVSAKEARWRAETRKTKKVVFGSCDDKDGGGVAKTRARVVEMLWVDCPEFISAPSQF